MFADRALLQAVCFAELPHCLAIFPRAQTEHEFLPYRLRQRLPAMEHLVAAQPDLPIFRRTNSRPLDGYFLSHHVIHDWGMDNGFELNEHPLIAFVPTRDPDRARAFYRDLLGLRLISEQLPFALVFDAHGVMLRVTVVNELTPPPYTA